MQRALPDYRQAFRGYGFCTETMTPEEAAAKLLSRPARARTVLVGALDHWLILARHEKSPEADWLERVLARADPDGWRQRLRAARTHNDRQALEQLAAEVDPAEQPPEALFVLNLALWQRGAREAAVALLRRARHAHPADFWINHSLGLALVEIRPPRYEDAIRFLTVAAALRPDSPGAHFNLGQALEKRGRLDEAVVALRQAVALRPDYAVAHHFLGTTFLAQVRLDEAITSCRRAVELRPDWPGTHRVLGAALSSKGRPAEAAAAFRRAIELRPDYAEAYCDLGDLLLARGELVQALAAFERGHALGARRPDWPYPSARRVQKCRRLVELEGRLPAILRGEVQPASAAERSEFAVLCHAKQHYLAAARFWAEAFSAGPKLAADLASGRREEAACAAALAAAGQGKDATLLDGKERSRWRKQALHWLRDDLADLTHILGNGEPRDRRLVRQRLWSWRCEPEMASLRDPAEVARLPEDERRECRQLWEGVESLRKRMNPPP